MNIVRESAATQAICAEVRREKKIIVLSILPPFRENPGLHALRANYVAMFFRQASGLMLQLDASLDDGWNEADWLV